MRHTCRCCEHQQVLAGWPADACKDAVGEPRCIRAHFGMRLLALNELREKCREPKMIGVMSAMGGSSQVFETINKQSLEFYLKALRIPRQDWLSLDDDLFDLHNAIQQHNNGDAAFGVKDIAALKGLDVNPTTECDTE